MMRIAVTGSAGYLGQLLLPLLDRHGEVDSILGLDISPGRFSSPKYAFRTADLRTADFKKLLIGVDVLYHLAFIVEPPREMSMRTIDEINIAGGRRVVEGALAAGVGKIVVASSIAAYGAHADNPVPLTEESPLRPNQDWYYSRAKGMVESLLDEMQMRHPSVSFIRFRPSAFLGPSAGNSVSKHYASRILIGLKRGHRMDHCWDGDVADAFILALSYPGSGIFNLAGGNPVTLEDAGRLLGKKVIYLPHPVVSMCIRMAASAGLVSRGFTDWVDVATRGSIIVSADLAKDRLGWKPGFDSAGALREFAAQRSLIHGASPPGGTGRQRNRAQGG
jgi:UDP-glucose 4-epimerase